MSIPFAASPPPPDINESADDGRVLAREFGVMAARLDAFLRTAEGEGNGGTSPPGHAGLHPLPGPATRLGRLARRFGLDRLDLDLLLLAAAPELDPSLADRLARTPMGDGNRPTVALAETLLGGDDGGDGRDGLSGRLAVRERLTADAPLRRHDLIRLDGSHEYDDTFSLARAPFCIPHRVLQFLLGDDHPDPYIRQYVQVLDPSVTFDTLHLPGPQARAVRDLLTSDRGAWWDSRPPEVAQGHVILLVSGPTGSGRQAFAEAVAAFLGLRVLRVATRDLCREKEDYGPMVRRLLLEARLQGALPVFADGSPFVPGEDFDADGFRILMTKLASYDHPVVLLLDRPIEFGSFPPHKLVLRVDLDPVQVPARLELWRRALRNVAVDGEFDLRNLAKVFNFGGGGIREMVREAQNRALMRGGPLAAVTSDDLMAAGREVQSRRMGKYTRKMVPTVTLEDLVVPDRVRRTIKEIIQTIRYRHVVYSDWGFGRKVSTGKGLCALFSGPPGSGKSMAAQVIARELGMNLFRVNLARVVSKYVGETEENLSRVFEEARESHSILLFDEADALFARRTRVRSAQDRYANLEVNFLLQEVEGFEGMVVLTTNLETSIDKAFKRRLNYRVFFPFPDAAARAEIWRRLFPPEAPLAKDIDWAALGEEFEFSGGYIKNAVVRAAQWAAEGEGVITEELLFRAAEVELAETGRLVRESD